MWIEGETDAEGTYSLGFLSEFVCSRIEKHISLRETLSPLYKYRALSKYVQPRDAWQILAVCMLNSS